MKLYRAVNLRGTPLQSFLLPPRSPPRIHHFPFIRLPQTVLARPLHAPQKVSSRDLLPLTWLPSMRFDTPLPRQKLRTTSLPDLAKLDTTSTTFDHVQDFEPCSPPYIETLHRGLRHELSPPRCLRVCQSCIVQGRMLFARDSI